MKGIEVQVIIAAITIAMFAASVPAWQTSRVTTSGSGGINFAYSYPEVWTTGQVTDSYGTRISDGKTWYKVSLDNHNLLHNSGANATRDMVGIGISTSAGFNVIALSNNTAAPVATGTNSTNEINDCGLSRAAGTTRSMPEQVGNWSISKVFTFTCGAADKYMTNLNTTYLFNSTAGAQPASTLFASFTFANTTLANSDLINITWINGVTGAP